VRKVALTAAVALLAPIPAAHAHPGPWYWTKGYLFQRLEGKRITIGSKRVPVRLDTLACEGEGRSVIRHGARAWKHFHCTQPTFPPGALVGPDAIFRVHVVGRTRYLITDAHFARY
jgi:hypothetical protein